MSITTRALAALAAAVLLSFVAAAAAHADDEPEPVPVAVADCSPSEETTLAAVECAGIEPVADLDPLDTEPVIARAAALATEAASLPANCRYRSEDVFYAATDWIRLVKSLTTDASPCADFYVSVPPLVADKTKPRPGEAARIRAFGPHAHAMSEVHYATWSAWVRLAPGRTFYSAGVEAGTRIVAAGYETWALNEIPSTVRQGQPGTRANAAEFIRGLLDGSHVPGLVFVTGVGQPTSPLDVYYGNLDRWLGDSLFWSSISAAVRFWAQEVYGDVRNWAVPDASRNDRTRHLADYLMHGADLAETHDDDAVMAPARGLMERTYVPLANAAWPWPNAFGYTDVTAELMESYVSEQVFATRHYAGAHPNGAPAGRMGFAWAPRVVPPAKTIDAVATQLILDRIARALGESYAQGGSSQAGACGDARDHDWCEGELDGSRFVDGWSAFSSR